MSLVPAMSATIRMASGIPAEIAARTDLQPTIAPVTDVARSPRPLARPPEHEHAYETCCE